MPNDTEDHWQTVYRTKRPDEVSWFTPHLRVSMALLKQAGMSPDTRLIDIGAGASTLVDDLLDLGMRHITALDISAASLELAQRRLGARAAEVRWLVADAAHLDLPPLSYALWHDRAVLHFLTDVADQKAYVAAATRTIVSGGFAVIGGFASDGPERCSRLPVARREAKDIAELFYPAFTLVHSQREMHTTPSGTPQSFAYALLRKTGTV